MYAMGLQLTELAFLVYVPLLRWLPQCTMTDDTAAVGEQRLVGWLVGSRGVACPADQVIVRVRDRQTNYPR